MHDGAMADFEFREILPLGADETPYRRIDVDGVTTMSAGGHEFLRVEPHVLTRLTAEAMRDIAHLLRPGHLQQLRNILDDPEASDNDRFVALDLLKNASIAAGGILPMCQDTGTAIVKAKKGQFVIALGNPSGIARDGQVSATWGILSNVSRRAPVTSGKPSVHRNGTLLQTDARLEHGTSGGALVNLRGEMIGLTTSLAARRGALAMKSSDAAGCTRSGCRVRASSGRVIPSRTSGIC